MGVRDQVVLVDVLPLELGDWWLWGHWWAELLVVRRDVVGAVSEKGDRESKEEIWRGSVLLRCKEEEMWKQGILLDNSEKG